MGSIDASTLLLNGLAVAFCNDIDTAVAALVLRREQLARATNVFKEMASETGGQALQLQQRRKMTGNNDDMWPRRYALDTVFVEPTDLRLQRLAFAVSLSVCALVTVLEPEGIMAAMWWASEFGRMKGELCDELGFAIILPPLYFVGPPGLVLYYVLLRRRGWVPSAQWKVGGMGTGRSPSSVRHWLRAMTVDIGLFAVMAVAPVIVWIFVVEVSGFETIFAFVIAIFIVLAVSWHYL